MGHETYQRARVDSLLRAYPHGHFPVLAMDFNSSFPRCRPVEKDENGWLRETVIEGHIPIRQPFEG